MLSGDNRELGAMLHVAGRLSFYDDCICMPEHEKIAFVHIYFLNKQNLPPLLAAIKSW